MKKYDIDTGPYGNGYRTEEDEFGLFVYADDAEDEIARLTRERDEAVRVAVWAAKHEAEVLPAKMGLPSMLSWNGRVGVKFPIEYRQLPLTDTTDSDIYRALREAMGASEGGGDGD